MAVSSAAAGLLGCLVVAAGLHVVQACRPWAPLFDHAVLMADMLHSPPHIGRGHNEHLPVLPRLVFWLEALLTSGDTRVPVLVGLCALGGGAVVATRAWHGGTRPLAALLLLAGLLRPSLAWSVSWPTNIQYPLAFLGASVAFWAAARASWGQAALGGVWAALASAEGLMVLPMTAVWAASRGDRRSGLGLLVMTGLVIAWTTAGGSSALRLPASGEEYGQLFRFAGDLLAFPWSLRLWLVLVLPLAMAGVHKVGRARRWDPVLAAMSVYGVGFFLLVVVGRWWLVFVHHRYALGATLFVVCGLLAAELGADGARGDRPISRWISLGLAVVLVLEAGWLGPAVGTNCVAREPEGTAFWRGLSDDGSDAHPGFAPEIALELREHLWRAGLYRPPTVPDPS